VGGAALADSLRTAAIDAGITIVTTYGMTETSGGCIYEGRPLDGVETRVEPDGRLSIRGPMIALGYLNDPETTCAAFVDGWFLTSDLGEIEHGRIRVLGRADAVINSGGEKVSLPAVEAAVRRHPMVIDAIAAGGPDATWGERLVVGVVASGPVSLADLREHVATLVDRVHAPRALVLLREIPSTALGKPDRPALLTHPITEEI
jgi:O-succinylbenzoic acid--CoA ligase